MTDIDGTYIPDEEVEHWEYESDKAKHDERGNKMTVEERAEEFAKCYVPLIAPLDEGSYQLSKNEIEKVLSDCSIDSFITGATSQWHYVKDGDLPEDNGKAVLCFTNHKGIPYMIDFVIKRQGVRLWNFNLMEQVIAWCELPEVPEEK